MRRYWIVAFVLLFSAPVYAADFIVHVPDGLIEEGAKWHHYYKEPREESKQQFVLDRSMPLMDTTISILTWGKIKSFEESGITVEVNND